MLAELAAANAAFDVIKQTIQNGQEIYAAGEALAEYFGLKAELQKKAHEHGYKSDLQAFLANEELKAREEELKELFIWQGRPGLWSDWLEFQSQMKKSREEEEKQKRLAKKKRKQRLVDTVVYGSLALAVLGSIGLIVWIFMQIAKG
jgi:nitrate reductase NapE component